MNRKMSKKKRWRAPPIGHTELLCFPRMHSDKNALCWWEWGLTADFLSGQEINKSKVILSTTQRSYYQQLMFLCERGTTRLCINHVTSETVGATGFHWTQHFSNREIVPPHQNDEPFCVGLLGKTSIKTFTFRRLWQEGRMFLEASVNFIISNMSSVGGLVLHTTCCVEGFSMSSHWFKGTWSQIGVDLPHDAINLGRGPKCGRAH